MPPPGRRKINAFSVLTLRRSKLKPVIMKKPLFITLLLVSAVLLAASCAPEFEWDHGSGGIHSRAINDAGEGSATYVVQFKAARFKPNPTSRAAFVAALGETKVIFRHNVVIYDNNVTGCDDQTLKDKLQGSDPDTTPPCKDVGQQVTQRAGFNNSANLREALRHLANSP